MPTSLPRFPVPDLGPSAPWGWRGIQYTVTKAARWKTRIQESSAGDEVRLGYWTRPRWQFELRWSILEDDAASLANATPFAPQDELRTIIGFFNARHGSLEPFCLRDPGDQRVTNQVIAASTPAPTADPANPDSRNYQVVRTYGGATEPVGVVNEGTDGEPAPIIYDDGVPVSASWNDPRDGWVRLDVAPAAGSVLTVDVSYYHKVRFVRDTEEWAQFLSDFWEARKIEMQTVWP